MGKYRYVLPNALWLTNPFCSSILTTDDTVECGGRGSGMSSSKSRTVHSPFSQIICINSSSVRVNLSMFTVFLRNITSLSFIRLIFTLKTEIFFRNLSLPADYVAFKHSLHWQAG